MMNRNMHPWIRTVEAGGDGGGGEVPAEPTQPKAAPTKADNGRGFPEGTPLERMSVEQREAYWKHYARQHEDEVKALKSQYGLDEIAPDQFADLRDKAERYDALEYELQSEQDKALDSARKEAAEQARAELMPQLVRASFEALAARSGVDLDRLSVQLEYADMSKFVAKGKVDTEAITKYVETMKPARQQFPSAIGLGQRGQGGYILGERGRAEAQRRFGEQK